MNWLRAFVLVVVASGCTDTRETRSDSTDQPPTNETPSTAMVYQCTDGYSFAVRFDGEQARVHLPRRTVSLPPVQSASGARFSDGTITYWSQGDEARLDSEDGTAHECQVEPIAGPWVDAQQRGVDFRGYGNEPGWYIEISHGDETLFVGDYGEIRDTFPTPESTSLAGGTTQYHAESGGEELLVRIVEGLCHDVMSGEPFPSIVTVTVNGRWFEGCGRALGSGQTAP